MNSFQLKIIALVTMIIDHIGAVFSLPFIFRCIGRISFPIYAFLISEGCKHTKNIKKYLLRIGIFALVSEIPYDLLFEHFEQSSLEINFFQSTNIFYTLFIGIFSVYIYEITKEMLKDSIIALIFSSILCFLGYLLSTDYGIAGALLILLLYYFNERKYQIIIILCFILYKYLFNFILYQYLYHDYTNIDSIWLSAFSMLSLFFIYMYNNKKGINLKWFFYIIYPLHLIVLYIIIKIF